MLGGRKRVVDCAPPPAQTGPESTPTPSRRGTGQGQTSLFSIAWLNIILRRLNFFALVLHRHDSQLPFGSKTLRSDEARRSSASVTCAACCPAIFNIIMTPERISRSTRTARGPVAYNFLPQAISLPFPRSAACIIAMSVEPRDARLDTWSLSLHRIVPKPAIH